MKHIFNLTLKHNNKHQKSRQDFTFILNSSCLDFLAFFVNLSLTSSFTPILLFHLYGKIYAHLSIFMLQAFNILYQSLIRNTQN